MDNIFNIVSSVHDMVVFNIIIKYDITINISKNNDLIFVNVSRLNSGNINCSIAKYEGSINNEEYSDIKKTILELINNKEIKYIEGYSDSGNKDILNKYCFEIYNENEPIINIFKMF